MRYVMSKAARNFSVMDIGKFICKSIAWRRNYDHVNRAEYLFLHSESSDPCTGRRVGNQIVRSSGHI